MSRQMTRPVIAMAFCVTVAAVAHAQSAQPTTPLNSRDDVILDMNAAFKRGDKARLTARLPEARGHALEAWAAYWELRARMADASSAEFQNFFARYPNTYQEDRLRNDFLLLLGARRDWAQFESVHGSFRMNDDREVQCYATTVEFIKNQSATPAMVETVRRNWLGQRDSDDGCTNAVDHLYAAKLMPASDLWRKARLAMESNRPRAARDAVSMLSPESLPLLQEINDSSTKFLLKRATAGGKTKQEMIVLALVKMAASDFEQASRLLDAKWSVQISPEERNWVWGVIGKQAAQKLSVDANGYFANVTKSSDLSDDMLAWKTRAALRVGSWKDVLASVNGMSADAKQDPTWIYWRARAMTALARNDAEKAEARQQLEAIAGIKGFYEQLALEDLGRQITLPAKPLPLTAQEKDAARLDPGLNRALYAIAIGLRTEGVREWNYTTNLHSRGGMSERELLAAADFACAREVWDRCINTSERTRESFEPDQRFPMPFHDAVIAKSQAINLDPAYVYGLIRQESRFVMDARSGVGASGLMQVMPATARWTAKKIGLTSFTPNQITDRDTNITIGTAYLKLALDDFDGSMALAAAAYNAGPGRPRSWRNGPVMDAAIWAENVPFPETRDYVKKVLSNATVYAAIISGQPQSLRARLGNIGPRPVNQPEPNKDLP